MDIQNYSAMYQEITLLQPEDTLQLIMETNDEKAKRFWNVIGNFLLQEKQRIAYRVLHGGHGIPDADVERRYAESFYHLNIIKDKCDLVVFYDNTTLFHRFAVYQNGNLDILTDQVPLWFAATFHISTSVYFYLFL